jgi:hypothetical protein
MDSCGAEDKLYILKKSKKLWIAPSNPIDDRLHYQYNPPLKTDSTASPHHLEAQQPKVTHLVF